MSGQKNRRWGVVRPGGALLALLLLASHPIAVVHLLSTAHAPSEPGHNSHVHVSAALAHQACGLVVSHISELPADDDDAADGCAVELALHQPGFEPAGRPPLVLPTPSLAGRLLEPASPAPSRAPLTFAPSHSPPASA